MEEEAISPLDFITDGGVLARNNFCLKPMSLPGIVQAACLPRRCYDWGLKRIAAKKKQVIVDGGSFTEKKTKHNFVGIQQHRPSDKNKNKKQRAQADFLLLDAREGTVSCTVLLKKTLSSYCTVLLSNVHLGPRPATGRGHLHSKG